MKKFLNLGIIFVLLFSCLMPLNSSAAKVRVATLNKRKVTISVGGISRLKVENATKKVVWKSSKKKIASVNKTGVVRGKKAGKTIVTAKVGKKILKCKVIVKDSPELVVDDVSLCVGATETLYVRGTGKKVDWITSDDSIVAVENLDKKTAKITAIGKGLTTIIAKVGKKELVCAVRVQSNVDVDLSDLKLSNSAVKTVNHLSDEIIASSSDESVAVVDVEYQGANGLYGEISNVYVYGLKDGTVDISISNPINNEVVTFKAIVEKPKENTVKQRIIDFVLKNYNDGGYNYYSYPLYKYSKPKGMKSFRKVYDRGNQTLRVFYDPFKDDVGFCYEDVGSFSALVWHMTPAEWAEKKYNVVFQEISIPIPGSSINVEERDFKAIFNRKNNLDEKLTFFNSNGITVDEFNQKDANEFHDEALAKLSALLEEIICVPMSEL